MHGDLSEGSSSSSSSNNQDRSRSTSHPMPAGTSNLAAASSMSKDMNSSFALEIKHYHTLATVGHGCGNGALIFSAMHMPNNNLVAIRKVDLEHENVDIKEVQREILRTRQLSHKNLLPYYCSFTNNLDLYIVMPYMAYGSAMDLLNYPFLQGMPELIVAFILRDVLQGLEYLHRRGIIHRSVKASHVMISSNGNVCLTGIRYACEMVRNGQLLKTMHNIMPNGTRNLNWLSPEVLEQNLQGYDTKSDVYSIGITACELANGAVPFSSMPPTQMLLEKLRGPTPLLLDACTCELIETPEQQSGQIEGLPNYFKERMFTEGFHQFVASCLQRNQVLRPNVTQLLHHIFFKQCRRSNVTLCELLHKLVPTAKNVDSNQLNSGISCPVVDSVSEKLEEMTTKDVAWVF